MFSNEKLDYIVSADDSGTINFYDMKENDIKETVGTVKGHANVRTRSADPLLVQHYSSSNDTLIIDRVNY